MYEKYKYLGAMLAHKKKYHMIEGEDDADVSLMVKATVEMDEFRDILVGDLEISNHELKVENEGEVLEEESKEEEDSNEQSYKENDEDNVRKNST